RLAGREGGGVRGRDESGRGAASGRDVGDGLVQRACRAMRPVHDDLLSAMGPVRGGRGHREHGADPRLSACGDQPYLVLSTWYSDSNLTTRYRVPGTPRPQGEALSASPPPCGGNDGPDRSSG